MTRGAESLRAIAAGLNARGIPTARGAGGGRSETVPSDGTMRRARATKRREAAMTKTVLALAPIVAMVGSAAAQQLPVPRQAGQQCPAGYASGALYCAPLPGTTRNAIRKFRQCPANWITSGAYCLSPEKRSGR